MKKAKNVNKGLQNKRNLNAPMWKTILLTLQELLVFFLLIAFVVTCSVTLFLSLFADELGIVFTEENIGAAAKMTFLNVLFLTVLFTGIDRLRRYLTVTRPLAAIRASATQMASGDFSARVSVPAFWTQNGFSEIAVLLNQMAEELSGIETLRKDFVADVSHEIKTPLSAIQNYVTLLSAEELSSDKRKEYLIATEKATRRLSSLISNILRLNKLENQKIFAKRELFDLSREVCEAFLAFEPIWEEKEISVTCEVADGILLCSDRELLSPVFNNLFSNAFKFTPCGGHVFLRLQMHADSAVLEVKDTGCGMEPSVGARIFEKFYQGDASRATEGNGLGLALVRRVIDIVGGDIAVESEKGKGSLFTVTLYGASRREPSGANREDRA